MSVVTPSSTPASTISLRATSPLLVGRTEELRTLFDAVNRPPSITLVEGEAGIGKTRLVHELLSNPHDTGRWITSGGCHPVREPFPYGPVVEALRGAGPRLSAPGRLSPVVGALRPLLPELAGHLPSRPDALDDAEAERHRLFRAFSELLSGCGPTVLVLEDLHWADENTWELLRFLGSHGCPRLSIVATCRSDENSPGLHGLGRRREDVTSALIRLAPLDIDGVRHLATALLGESVISADFVAKLHERTAGIPFVVEEALRALPDPAAAVRSDGSRARHLLEEATVPALLKEAVASRLATVSSSARRVVSTLAVLGVPSTAPTLSAMSGLPVTRVDAGLVELLRVGAVQESALNHYGFRHALARDAIYDGIPGPHRQCLHRRAATVLAELDTPPLVQIATHFRLAGEIQRWCEVAEAAADQAEERGDSGLATELLHGLVAERSMAGDRLDRLAVKLSRSAHGALGAGSSAEVLGRLLADERLSHRTRSTVRMHRGLLLTRQPGGIEIGRTDLAHAVQELRDSDPGTALYGMTILARAEEGSAEFTEHARWLRQVDQELANDHPPEVLAKVLANHLHTVVQIGSPDAEAQVRQLPSQSSTRVEHRHLTRAHLNLGDAYGWVGRFDRARHHLHTGLRWADNGGTPYLLSIAGATEAHLDWWTGRWFGLRERCEQLLQRYADVRDVAAELSLVLGSLAVAGGEWGSAEAYLRSPGLMEHADSAFPTVVTGAAAMTRLLLSRDEDERAYAEAAEELTFVRRKGVWVWAAELVPEFAESCCRTGRTAEAAGVLAEFDRGIVGRDAPLAGAASRLGDGIVAFASGEYRIAEQHFDDARHAYAQLPLPYFASLSAERAALCRLRSQEADPAELFAPIADEFDALGAIRDAARCRHLLRSTGNGVPSRRGRRGYGEQLSPREQEVARLIATGHTNRAIADVLFLSPRTVEHHVAKVLHKTGVGTRAELSAQMLPQPG